MSYPGINAKTIIFTLTLVSLIIIVYAVVTNAYIEILRVKPLTLVLAIAIYLTSWLISAVRLMYLDVKFTGKSIGLKNYLYARILGGLVAYLTPSAIGGEPARSYYLYLLKNENYSKYFALTIYEVYYDIMITAIVAIGFSIKTIPFSTPVIIVSLANMAFWIIAYFIFRNITINSSNRIVDKLVKIIEDKVIARSKLLKTGYYTFGESFNTICNKLSLRDKIVVVILTLLFNIGCSSTIYIVSNEFKPCSNIYCRVELFVDSLAAYHYALSIGALPTPGGAGAVEYGLSITLDPATVIISRSITYYTIVVFGFITLLKTISKTREKTFLPE